MEIEGPSEKAIIHGGSDGPVIGPLRKRGLLALLQVMAPLDENLPAIDDPVPAPEHQM